MGHMDSKQQMPWALNAGWALIVFFVVLLLVPGNTGWALLSLAVGVVFVATGLIQRSIERR